MQVITEMNRQNIKLVLEKVSSVARESSTAANLEETKESIMTLIKLGTRKPLIDISDYHLPAVLQMIEQFSKSPAKIELPNEFCTYCGCDPCDCDWGYNDYVEGYDNYIQEFGEEDFKKLANLKSDEDEGE